MVFSIQHGFIWNHLYNKTNTTGQASIQSVKTIPFMGAETFENSFTMNPSVSKRVKVGSFPPEIWKKILEELLPVLPEKLTKESLVEWRSAFGDMIEYRMVCTTWMLLIDDILEKDLISLIGKWKPNIDLCVLFPSTLLEFDIGPERVRVLKNGNEIPYDSLLTDYKASPLLPARTLVVSNLHFSERVEIEVKELIVENISVLWLSGVVCHLEKFITILNVAKGLKVLVLNGLSLHQKSVDTVHSVELEALPQLKSLFLLGCINILNSDQNTKKDENTPALLQNWKFNAYSNKLEQLEIRYEKTMHIDPMPNLKQLSIIAYRRSFFNQFGSSSKLERLSITGFMRSRNKRLKFNDMFAFIGQFASTLVEVNLDIHLFDYVSGSSGDNQAQQGQQFPRLSKLTLRYPEIHDEIKMITKRIVKKVPVLQHLVFLRLKPHSGRFPICYLHENCLYSAPAFFNRIWLACSNLKIISVIELAKSRCNNKGHLQIFFERPNDV